MNKEVITSYPIKCIGDYIPLQEQLSTDPSSCDISLTVYKDGNREVGCSFLLTEICAKGGLHRHNSRCVHLFPEESTK